MTIQVSDEAGLREAQAGWRRDIGQGRHPIVSLNGEIRLTHPLVLDARDSHLTIQGGSITGSIPLKLTWQPYQNGIMKAAVPEGFDTDQLFVNGQAQTLARYPNLTLNSPQMNGKYDDVLSKERVSSWKNPSGGYIHALQSYRWGSLHFRITGKDPSGQVTFEGGWQNNRQEGGMSHTEMFVEGIFEELDWPGEWFLDRSTHVLYYYPPDGLKLENAKVEGVGPAHLIELRGTRKAPVKDVRIEGVTFARTKRTFMENKEPLLRSDWTIYRGAALLATGTEGCRIDQCYFDAVGGNAIFASNYNKRLTISRCRIENAGANGIAFVGNPSGVRNPLFQYSQKQKLDDLDRTPGPKDDDHPADCLVDNCLISGIGRTEKQSAGVEISMSQRITVCHCSIYDTPRAGINIGDGCWGGDVIEFCDVFDTVKETGDHGSFNSWGRDRYWNLDYVDLNELTETGLTKLPLLDTVQPITLRNNRWRCDHGWDVDLDDGSTNYRIIDNLCLNGGIKLREGFDRVCENNITVNNSIHTHVWFMDSDDVIRRNIVFTPYKPIGMPKVWGKEVDYNWQVGGNSIAPAKVLQRESGRDTHSLIGPLPVANFMAGDYTVPHDSPVLKLGFKNFPMEQFGVTDPKLRKLARTPMMPKLSSVASSESLVQVWCGAKVKRVETLGEQSALGLPDISGFYIVDCPEDSPAYETGFRVRDAFRFDAHHHPIRTLEDMPKLRSKAAITVWRDQHEVTVQIS